MAEGASYPVRLVNADDKTSFGTTLVFTDSSNQPDPAQVYVQTTDPGAVGAGALWLNTTAISLTTNSPLSVRNAANDAWVPLGLAMYDSGGFLRAQVTLNVNGGVGIESRDGTAAAKSFLILKNTTGKLKAATTLTIQGGTLLNLAALGGAVSISSSVGGVGVSAAAAAGDASRINQVSPLFTTTSGALSTQQLVSGTGAQVSTSSDVETYTLFTTDGTANVASCTPALSPDNVTYSTLFVPTASAAVNTVGAVGIPLTVRVPAGWYLKMTAVHGTLGVTTFA